mmetsp:Transcript_8904/g.13286  ORF Transcript_8904/g.13286 Transcript_8904/m.13286 type:complete len:131 (+) Transcript_8904:78-470(+)
MKFSSPSIILAAVTIASCQQYFQEVNAFSPHAMRKPRPGALISSTLARCAKGDYFSCPQEGEQEEGYTEIDDTANTCESAGSNEQLCAQYRNSGLRCVYCERIEEDDFALPFCATRGSPPTRLATCRRPR